MGHSTLNISRSSITTTKQLHNLPSFTATNQTTITMESVKQAANYVSESVKGATSQASKEANKEVAKDSNAPIGTRFNAATDALGDKADQHGHNTAADVHKEAAKH